MEERPTVRFRKTRIAPTPSGFLHIGNAYSFALTAALARRTGASLLLRIDDMDEARKDIRYMEDIFSGLRYLGIPWQEGPTDINSFHSGWSQRLRMPGYTEALEQLRASGRLFACSCSRSDIGAGGIYDGRCLTRGISFDEPGVCWRLVTPSAESVRLHLLDGSRHTERLSPAVRYFIVRKKDGDPAYQLTSLLDDTRFGIDFIVRGQDLYDSTVCQLLLAKCLGIAAFAKTVFYFHPLLRDDTGNKLSKSAGSTSLRAMRETGLSSAGIYQLIGTRGGLSGPVTDWESLGKLAVPY